MSSATFVGRVGVPKQRERFRLAPHYLALYWPALLRIEGDAMRRPYEANAEVSQLRARPGHAGAQLSSKSLDQAGIHQQAIEPPRLGTVRTQIE